MGGPYSKKEVTDMIRDSGVVRYLFTLCEDVSL